MKEEQSSILWIYLEVLSIWASHLCKSIKTVQVDQYANLQDQAPKENRDIQLHLILSPADADDDFGFNETVSFFQDAKDRDLTTGTDKTSTND